MGTALQDTVPGRRWDAVSVAAAVAVHGENLGYHELRAIELSVWGTLSNVLGCDLVRKDS